MLSAKARFLMSSPSRDRLPETRTSITHKFEIDGHDGYIIVGLYQDGRPGEVFLKMGKEGSTLGGLLDCIGILTSVALQYGVPVETLVTKLSHVRFEPCGMTKNQQIPMAKSIVDYIFRWMQLVFLEAQQQSVEASQD
jgi:ribonucleoside-diphosphate reductase alpha chain